LNELEEKYIVQLRDCFNAGYQFPQYCIDNNIKKPLFVGVDESQKNFLWEIYAQFKHLNRPVTINFAFLNVESKRVSFASYAMIAPMSIQNFHALNLDNFDKIIFLTAAKLERQFNNAVYLNDLCAYFISRTYLDIPLLHFMKKHPKVKLIVTNMPRNPAKDPAFMKSLVGIENLRIKLSNDKSGKIKTTLDKFGYTNAEVMSIIACPRVVKNADDSTKIQDDDRPLLRIKNGRRETSYQPTNYINTIYFVGASHHFGYFTPYDKTIESYLQKLIVEKNFPYRVENLGQPYFFRMQAMFYNLNTLNLKPGDIIFFAPLSNLKPVQLPFCDVGNAFDSYDYKEIFAEQSHVNELGYKILAEKYFNYLTENDFFKHTDFEYPPPHLYRIVMVYRRKIFQSKNRLQKNFSTNRNWKITGKGCVSDDLKSVA